MLEGAQFHAFTEEAKLRFYQESYTVTPQSDRMGYRLKGAPLELREPLEMVSEAVTFGTVQVPPDGNPIILLADRQTTGAIRGWRISYPPIFLSSPKRCRGTHYVPGRFAGGSGNAALEGTAAEGAESKAQNGMGDLTKGLKTMENKNKTVIKSMELLHLFLTEQSLSLNELVSLSEMPKTSVHRMASSLEETGFSPGRRTAVISLV